MVHNSPISISQSVRLSFTDKGVPPVIHVKQYDRLTRKIRFTLFENKQQYAIPGTASVFVSGARKDGGLFQYSTQDENNEVIDTENDQVVMVVTEYMTDIAGKYPVDIVLRDSQQAVLRTFSFMLEVEPCAAGNAKALLRSTDESIHNAQMNITDVFITEDGYFAMNTDDGTQIEQGSQAEIVQLIHDQMVTASINDNGIMEYETEDSYNFIFGMDNVGRIFVRYKEDEGWLPISGNE